jgi:hypothetical protein
MRLSGFYEIFVFIYKYPFLDREYKTADARPLYFNRFSFLYFSDL